METPVRRVRFGVPVELEVEETSSLTGELVDPDAPLFRVLLPNGETADPEVEHISEGKFRCTYDPTEWGIHRWLFMGEGEWKTAGETWFEVRKPKVPRD